MDKGEKKVLSDVKKFGWSVVYVESNDKGPNFAFSIGLFQKYKHSEIIIFGLNQEIMHHLINIIGGNIKNGQRYEAGKEYFEIINKYACVFKTVNKSNYKHYLGFALWFYKSDDFPVLQCVWPDKNGKFTWDSTFDKTFTDKQPRLDVDSN